MFQIVNRKSKIVNSIYVDKKSSRYLRLEKQITDLIKKNKDMDARMATINAILYHKMDGFFWVGFYLLKDGHLLVGPYQGPLACLELEKDKGVCWAGINQNQTIVVQDVHQFPGHIACDSTFKIRNSGTHKKPR